MAGKNKRKGFVKYDYDKTFTESLEGAEEQRIKKMLENGFIKSIYATKTIKHGNQFDIEIYPEFTRKESQKYKLEKTNRVQKNLNDKNARKKLERLINENFKKGDFWITLTYDKENIPKDMERARKDIQNFIKRINYRRKKEGLENAKYVYVTEWSRKKKIRCHHHLIMDCGLLMDTVEKMWKKGGRNNVRRITPDEDGLTGLANYITKDPEGTKRWCSSLNLKEPKERKTYSGFKASQIKKIVQGRTSTRELVEKKYKNMKYLYEEIKYNEVNGKFYVYVRMREREKE